MPFARVCGKMRWQFGGNLQPVRMICEFDWRECPSAIISYIWSEVVTDVVDCLTNEWMLWRVIAMLFVCTLLVHTIYSKTRLMDETTINRDSLNIVGCKVQDLELKVNILTYKMQYGTWPLPRQIRGTGIEGGLRNVRLTLTSSQDRNAWLKHMLLSPSENAEFVPYAKIGPRSVRCLTKLINLETKYMSSRFSGDASPASIKTRSSSSEKSMRYEKNSKKSSDSVDDRADEKYIPKSEDLGMRRNDSARSSRKETNCWSETQVLKYRKHPRSHSRNEHHNFEDSDGEKKMEKIFTSPDERENLISSLNHYPKNVSKKCSTSARKIDECTTRNFEEYVDFEQPQKYREHPRSPSRPYSESEHRTLDDSAGGKKIEEIFTNPDERENSIETLNYHPRGSSKKLSASARKIDKYTTKNSEEHTDFDRPLKYREHAKSSSRPHSRNEYRTFDDTANGKKIEQIYTSPDERENPIQSSNYPKYSKKLSASRKIDESTTQNPEDRKNYDQPLQYRENEKSSSRLQRRESTKKLSASNGKSEEIGESSEDRVNSTNETLHQVKEKLENLHSVLRIYGSPESTTKTEEVCSRKELAESILRDLKNLGDFATESESDGKTKSCVPGLLDSNTEESQCPREETDSTSEFEQCRSDRDSSSARSHENPVEHFDDRVAEKTDSKNLPKSSLSEENLFEKKFQDERTMLSRETKNSPEVDDLGEDKNRPTESSDEDAKKFMRTELKHAAQPSPTSSQTELSKDSDTDDRTNATLLREALKFKKALLTQIELDNEEKNLKIEDSEGRMIEESDAESDEPHWPKVKNHFQSKLLDIISEEQSASSSTEKTSKTLALAKPPTKTERPDENVSLSNENSPNSKLALVSESSEYFSLSNLEEKLAAQRTMSVTRNETPESGGDSTEDDRDDRDLKKNISDLVDQSVRNIREYIEVFSQIQSDAIVETSRAMIDDEPPNVSSLLRECSSEDSIMHFVNTVAMSDSVCEQLPRKLSEPLINSLLDLSEEEFLGSPENPDRRPDFSLKRRPGYTSLAEQPDEKSCDRHEALSLFESAHSEIGDDDDGSKNDALSSEPSCKELLMDYSLGSDSDLTDDKLSATLNLIVFEEENEPRARDESDERARCIDSPLTGRTVIRAIASSTANIGESTSEIVDTNVLQKKDEHIGVEVFTDSEINRDTSEKKIVPETSSVYFADGLSISERTIDKPEEVEETMDNVSESSTWILEKSVKNLNPEREYIETGYSEELTKSAEKSHIEGVEEKRPEVSGETIVRGEIEREEAVASRANLSSDNSGTYMDASSRDYLNSSGVSLVFDKSILDPSPKRIDIATASKSARGSSSSPLRQRVPWNAPRRGSSLNNASSVRSRKPERSSSRLEKSRENSSIDKSEENTSIDKSKENSSIDKSKRNSSIDKSKKNSSIHKSRENSSNEKSKENSSIDKPNKNSKPERSQSTSCKEIRAKSNFSLPGAKDPESSSVTTGQRSNKSAHELQERRSRSYATPRKSEASPRDSTTSQPPENARPSRTRRDVDTATTNLESSKSESASGVLNSKPSSKSCLTRTSSKSCIPILKSRLESARQTRAKSPMRGPLTMSMSSWSQEARRTTQDHRASPETNVPSEGSPQVGREDESSMIVGSKEPYETLEKIERRMERPTSKLPESRTVIYVNIVTEQEHSATRVVDPKKFLEYLKDRDLKIQSVLDQEIGFESSLESTGEPADCCSPRVLTVVSSAVGENVPSNGSLRARSNNSALTGSWSLRVEQREIEVSAKPSVIDTSTSISDLLPDISTETPTGTPGKFKIFEVPKELTKDEYIVLLEALNQDPNLHQLREMHKLCNKLGLGFHE